jgi:hypothetical protein
MIGMPSHARNLHFAASKLQIPQFAQTTIKEVFVEGHEFTRAAEGYPNQALAVEFARSKRSPLLQIPLLQNHGLPHN